MPEFTRQLTQTLLWFTGLVLVVPLVATVADIVRREVSFSARAMWTGYVRYGFRILFLLVVQFSAIAVIFCVGPVWFFMFFLTVADFLVMRWTPEVSSLGAPLLCKWFDIVPATCPYVLVAYHGISAVLAFVVFRYGHRYFDTARAWYRRAAERLAARLAG